MFTESDLLFISHGAIVDHLWIYKHYKEEIKAFLQTYQAIFKISNYNMANLCLKVWNQAKDGLYKRPQFSTFIADMGYEY